MGSTIELIIRTLTYPADDIQSTLMIALAIVAFGLLLALILMALASPGAKQYNSHPVSTAETEGDE